MIDKPLAVKLKQDKFINTLLPFNFWLLESLIRFEEQDSNLTHKDIRIRSDFHNSNLFDLDFHKPVSKIFGNEGRR